MAKLEIQSVKIKKEMDWGNVYTLMGLLDGQLDSVEMATKPANAPKVGDVLEGTVEDSQYGKKFKKTPTGGFGGNGGKTYGKSQEEQDGMRWGNSLTNAVALVIAKASLSGKSDDISTDRVIAIARKLFAADHREKAQVSAPAPQDEGIAEAMEVFSEEGI